MFTINPGRQDPWASLILRAEAERQLAQRCRQRSLRASAAAKRDSGSSDVLVHIHAFHPLLLPELLAPIARHWPAPPPRLLITVPNHDGSDRLEACQAAVRETFAAGLPRCEWLEVENRGRNLLPLLQVVQHLSESETPSPLLLHLHTKQTLDPLGVGAAWREDLIDKLLGNTEQIRLALQLLAAPTVGLVAPTRFPGIERHYHWGGNFQLAAELVQRLLPGHTLQPDQLLHFPAGLMFWCRPEVLRPLLPLALDPSWCPDEPLGTNGTVLHALERLICHSVEATGAQWQLVDGSALANPPEQQHHDLGDDWAWPSVWERRPRPYQELLTRKLREERQRRQTQAQAEQALVLRVHGLERLKRQRRWPHWRRPPTQLGLLLQRVGKGFISSAYIRLIEPLHHLEQSNGAQVRILDQVEASSLCGLDQLIVQRGAVADPAAAQELLQLCRQLEIRLIVDLDDAIFSLPPVHAEAERYRFKAAATDLLLSHSDLAIFSTAALENLYRDHLAANGATIRRSTVIANGLSTRLWRAGDNPHLRRQALPESSPLQILYMGSATHDDDFQMLLPQLDALAAAQPGGFQLHVIGALTMAPERPWLQVRPVPLQARRYPQFVPWLLQRRAYHFGIAPLQAHAFNAGKSDVKVLDYAALGLGCLCSTGPAYDALIRQGLALGTSNDQWQQALEALLLDLRPIQHCGRRAERYLWRRRSCARVADQLRHVLHSLR